MGVADRIGACVALSMLLPRAARATAVSIANPIETGDFTTLVQNVLSWLLSVVGGVALLFLIYGGLVYVTAIGDQQKAQQGKKIVTSTILGLIIVLMSYSILVVLDRIFFAA